MEDIKFVDYYSKPFPTTNHLTNKQWRELTNYCIGLMKKYNIKIRLK